MAETRAIRLKNFGENFSGSLLPFGILALVGMLILPLPVALLDTFCCKHYTIFIDTYGCTTHASTIRLLSFSNLLHCYSLTFRLNVASTR